MSVCNQGAYADNFAEAVGWLLRILAIDDPKISQKLAFLGYWHKCIHGTPIHLALQKCITCQVATIGSILKFESK